MDTPKQSYTLQYFKRHARGMVQAGVHSDLYKNGCVVLDADHKPFLVVRPVALGMPPKTHAAESVSLTKLLSNFDSVVEERLIEAGTNQRLCIVYQDVLRLVVTIHPEWKKPEEKLHANDDSDPKIVDKLLDMVTSATALAERLRSSIDHLQHNRKDDVCAALLAALRRIDNIENEIGSILKYIEKRS